MVLARSQIVKPFCSAALPTPKPEASSCVVGNPDLTGLGKSRPLLGTRMSLWTLVEGSAK